MSYNDNPPNDFMKDFGRELSFDDLFAAEPTTTVTSPSTPEPTPQPQVVSQPEPAPVAAPQPPSFEPIRAGNTVYNSREELERGMSVKDSTIEQLRQFAIERTGIDPLKKANQPQYLPQQPQMPQGYYDNPERYLQDLVKGAESDPRLYVNAQAGLIDERVAQVLSPFAPILARVAREEAVKSVSHELKDFSQVQSSEHWNAVMTELPDLKQAIEGAEGNPQFQDRLPGLYKVAYFAARGRQLPELLKQAQAPAPQPPQQARPTLQASATTPPMQQATAPDIRTPEGRKALIAQMEQNGILDRRF